MHVHGAVDARRAMNRVLSSVLVPVLGWASAPRCLVHVFTIHLGEPAIGGSSTPTCDTHKADAPACNAATEGCKYDDLNKLCKSHDACVGVDKQETCQATAGCAWGVTCAKTGSGGAGQSDAEGACTTCTTDLCPMCADMHHAPHPHGHDQHSNRRTWSKQKRHRGMHATSTGPSMAVSSRPLIIEFEWVEDINTKTRQTCACSDSVLACDGTMQEGTHAIAWSDSTCMYACTMVRCWTCACFDVDTCARKQCNNAIDCHLQARAKTTMLLTAWTVPTTPAGHVPIHKRRTSATREKTASGNTTSVQAPLRYERHKPWKTKYLNLCMRYSTPILTEACFAAATLSTSLLPFPLHVNHRPQQVHLILLTTPHQIGRERVYAQTARTPLHSLRARLRHHWSSR